LGWLISVDINNYALEVLLFMVFIFEELMNNLDSKTAQSMLFQLAPNVLQAFVDCFRILDTFHENGTEQVLLRCFIF
jgi:hypothetical protein